MDKAITYYCPTPWEWPLPMGFTHLKNRMGKGTPSLWAMPSPIYLWRKVVCFVLWLWDQPNWDASDCVLNVCEEKLLMRRGAWASFHDGWTCGAKVIEYWMISSLKIKLNCSWKFQRNWNVSLVLLEKSWWIKFNGIYLVRFGFRMWEILIFK